MKKIKFITILTVITSLFIATPTLALPHHQDMICNNYEQSHGWLGIKVIDGGMEGAVDLVTGAMIIEIADDSPLNKLGFEYGDLITAINGREVRSTQDLLDNIEETMGEDKVVITTTTLNAGYLYKQTDHIVRLNTKSSYKTNNINNLKILYK